MKDPAKVNSNKPKGNLHLLAVSVDKYDEHGQFCNTFTDTKELIRVLQKQYGFKKKNRIWLPDERATKDNIVQALDDYCPDGDRALKREDSLLVWLSGHGQIRAGKDGKTYFIAVNGSLKGPTGWLGFDAMQGIFLNIKAKQILLISDSCFAGGMFKSTSSPSDIFNLFTAKLVNTKGRYGISAGRDIELVSAIGGAECRSVFASALIEALKANSKKVLTASELFVQIRKEMKDCATQIPQQGHLPNSGSRGGEFVFFQDVPYETNSQFRENNSNIFRLIFVVGFLVLVAILALLLTNIQQTRFHDVLTDGSPAPEMVIIPTGSIVIDKAMDSKDGSSGSHELLLNRRIAVSITEITWSEYSACIRAGGCKQNPHDFIIHDDHPVRGVSWDEANDYVNWLSNETTEDYRLLTSQEWEYAARAGNNDDQFFLDRLSADEAVIGNTEGLTKSVKADAPNNFGLYGMHGNVSEWTSSCYRKSDGECTEYKIIRGSSWTHEKGRNDYREIEYNDPKIGLKYVGFRIAREID